MSVPVHRILDASLNRAEEGLRVVEDYVRFVLDDRFLSQELKALRHELAARSAAICNELRLAARETRQDVGTELSTQSERERIDSRAVAIAAFRRTEQSLRSLEEFSKTIDAETARQFESLRYRVYTLEKAVGIGLRSRERLEAVRLCVLVDGCATLAEFEKLASALFEAGVGMVQLRDKMLNDRELVGRARALVEHARHHARAAPHGGTLAIVNDRADIAAAAHADGVHLGQTDLPIKEARSIVGPRALIGVSTHHVDQVREAVLGGADYLGAGPTFPSRTKSFDAFAGTEYLRQVSEETRLPTFAIGGITAENVGDVLTTGIRRVAVGAAVTSASDPASAAKLLLANLK